MVGISNLPNSLLKILDISLYSKEHSQIHPNSSNPGNIHESSTFVPCPILPLDILIKFELSFSIKLIGDAETLETHTLNFCSDLKSAQKSNHEDKKAKSIKQQLATCIM